jgi:hypothetical protein
VAPTKLPTNQPTKVKLPILDQTEQAVSPEEGSKGSSRNIVPSFLIYWTMDEVQRNSNLESNTPSS